MVSTPYPLPQRKRSLHERARAMVSSGEWSSGKRWADDAPKEAVDADTVSVIESGACGAFVHGLEDEFLGAQGGECGKRHCGAASKSYLHSARFSNI